MHRGRHRGRQAQNDAEEGAVSTRYTKEYYMARYPQYNRACAVCGKAFNAVHLGSKRRKTCSPQCSIEHAKRLQRENTKRYIKSEKYLEYRKKYFY